MYLKSPWKVLEKGMSWSVGTMQGVYEPLGHVYFLIADDKVKIIEFTTAVRKQEEGASVTVKWRAMKPDDKYEVRFVTYLGDDSTASCVSMKGLKNTTYTEDSLKHDKLYKITVSVVGKPESEGEAVMVKTPKPVWCKCSY